MITENQKPKTTAVSTPKQKEITSLVLNKINAFKDSGELKIPKDYSPENALKSAFLTLNEQVTRDKKPVLKACSQESVANALLKMVTWGVSPLKGQIYFVPYADKLEATISYTGNIAMAKRYAGLVDIKANLIMQGDVFEFKINPNTGRKEIATHQQTLESIGSPTILGAYAVYSTNDGQTDVEIMNMAQIKTSWNQGATKGNSPAHKNFPGEMAKRTIINKAVKIILRSSDDGALFESKNSEQIDVVKEDVDHKIQTEANQEVIDIDSVDVTEKEDPKKEPSF